MPRTTLDLLKKIIDVSSDETAEQAITDANDLVTEVCGGAGYTDGRLESIERYLAAHFYTVYDPRAVSGGAGGASESYQSAVAVGFDSSHYGQMAMRLDTAGGLAAINAKAKATASGGGSSAAASKVKLGYKFLGG